MQDRAKRLLCKKRLYYERISNGLCYSCGKLRDNASKTMCKECLEKLRQRSALRRKLEPEKVKNEMHEYSKKIHKQALEKIAKDKNIPLRCPCGCSNLDFLEIDHLDNNGNKERENLGGQAFCRAIRDGERTTEDLTILCRACNFIKYLNLAIEKGKWEIRFTN